jgi:hypothetical protein
MSAAQLSVVQFPVRRRHSAFQHFSTTKRMSVLQMPKQPLLPFVSIASYADKWMKSNRLRSKAGKVQLVRRGPEGCAQLGKVDGRFTSISAGRWSCPGTVMRYLAAVTDN